MFALAVLEQQAGADTSSSAQTDLATYAEYLRSTKGILDIRSFHKSGTGPNYLDVVVVSAGFTPDQMGEFHGVCERFSKALLSKNPWARYRNLVNIFAVFVGDKNEETSHLHVSGYKGGVLGCDNGTAVEYARYAANAAATVVIHNSQHSRGGTGVWGVVVLNKSSAATPMVPIHELGHGLAGLGDEYIQFNKPFDGDPLSLRDTVNVTPTASPKLSRWHYWTENEWPGLFGPLKLPKGTKVANFEGAGWVKKIYRPEENCFMRCNHGAFCAVCNETMEASFFRYIDPFQVVEPACEDLAIWKDEHIDMHVSAIDILQEPPEWLKSRLLLYLDGEVVASSDRGKVTFRFPGAKSGAGFHQLGANLNMQIDSVRRDFGFLSRSKGWRVQVVPWRKPRIDLPSRVIIPAGGAIDVPVTIRHEKPALFTLKMDYAPAGATLQNGRLQWKPIGAAGSWRVDFTVSYDSRQVVTESMEIHVTRAKSPEDAIEILPLDPIDAVTGKQAVLKLKANARDGGHLLFDSVKVPAGVELDRYTGSLTWTPQFDQAGPQPLRFRVHNGSAQRETEVLVRVRRAATPSPVSYSNQYKPQTLEALKQLKQSPLLYRRLFETQRLLRDRYEPLHQKALVDAKSLYEELGPVLRNNCLQELNLHAWDFTDKPEILNWMRALAQGEKAVTAGLLVQKLDQIDRYNANRVASVPKEP